MTGKTKEEQALKENILKHHTLEGVISLSKDTLWGRYNSLHRCVYGGWPAHWL